MRRSLPLAAAILAITCLLTFGGTASAAPIAGLDFDDGSGGYSPTPDDLDPLDVILVSGLGGIGSGNFVTSHDTASDAGRPSPPVGKLNGPDGSTTTPPAVGGAAPADGGFFSIWIPFYATVDLTNVSWISSKATGGTNQRWLAFKTSLDSGLLYSALGPSRPSFDTVSLPLSGAPYEGLTSTTVDFQWYSGGQGSGDMDIDSILIEGNVTVDVVEPEVCCAKVLLLGGAAAPTLGADDDVFTYLVQRYGSENVSYMQSSVAAGDPAGSAAGFDVLVLSSTPGSGDYRGKFNNVAVGMVNWEEAVMDNAAGEFGLSSAVMTKSTNTTQLTIDASHQITQGLSGTVDFVTSGEVLGTSSLYPGLTSLASAANGDAAGQPSIFIAEAGQNVDPASGSSPAAARRVMFPMTDNTFSSLTPEGLQLFGQAVDWAAGVPEPSSLSLTLIALLGLASLPRRRAARR